MGWLCWSLSWQGRDCGLTEPPRCLHRDPGQAGESQWGMKQMLHGRPEVSMHRSEVTASAERGAVPPCIMHGAGANWVTSMLRWCPALALSSGEEPGWAWGSVPVVAAAGG